DFRLYWLALAVSLLGVAFQTVAQGWLVYRLTNSAFMLGFTAFLPGVLSAPASIVGGVLADRLSRRKLVAVTQSLMVIPPIALAYLIWSMKVQVWHVILASTALGIVAALDLPSRMAMIPHLVDEEDVLNAQGLASAVRQVTRIVGPVTAGLVIATAGEAACFLINGLSYLAMVAAVLMMRPQPALLQNPQGGLRSTLLEGSAYVVRSPVILGLFGMLAAQGLFLSPYLTLMPVYARDVLNVGAVGLGWLNAAVGAGALVGALTVANLGQGQRGRVLVAGSAVMPLALGAYSFSRSYPLSLGLLTVMGFGTVVITAITATMLLVIVPDRIRGRVNSLGTLVYLGAPYTAGVVIGFLTERWGPAPPLSAAASLFLVAIILLNLRVPGLRELA
ncbi:MAG TPA: MFS transporter, partial [Candidatus Tectomicrobia bacterium]